MIPEQLLRKYRRSGGNDFAQLYRERETRGAWGKYNSNAQEYSKLFSPVLAGKTLHEVIGDLRTTGEPLVGIDFCGQGDIFTELDFDRGLSICLAHDYIRCNPPSDKLDKWDMDLMDNITWESVDKWVQENGQAAIIICAPGGAGRSFWNWGPYQIHDHYYRYSDQIFTITLTGMFNLLRPSGQLLIELRYPEAIYKMFDHVQTDGTMPRNMSVTIARSGYDVLCARRDDSLTSPAIKFLSDDEVKNLTKFLKQET